GRSDGRGEEERAERGRDAHPRRPVDHDRPAEGRLLLRPHDRREHPPDESVHGAHAEPQHVQRHRDGGERPEDPERRRPPEDQDPRRDHERAEVERLALELGGVGNQRRRIAHGGGERTKGSTPKLRRFNHSLRTRRPVPCAFSSSALPPSFSSPAPTATLTTPTRWPSDMTAKHPRPRPSPTAPPAPTSPPPVPS